MKYLKPINEWVTVVNTTIDTDEISRFFERAIDEIGLEVEETAGFESFRKYESRDIQWVLNNFMASEHNWQNASSYAHKDRGPEQVSYHITKRLLEKTTFLHITCAIDTSKVNDELVDYIEEIVDRINEKYFVMTSIYTSTMGVATPIFIFDISKKSELTNKITPFLKSIEDQIYKLK